MDRDQIMHDASAVWEVLTTKSAWTYDELKEATGLPDRELNAAFGWLASENKIQFTSNGKKEKVTSVCINIYFG